MKNLNNVWLALIVAGVVFLIGSIALSLYQSLNGEDKTFNLEVVEFDKKTLLTETLKDHINSSL